jgi:hypothetical protein
VNILDKVFSGKPSQRQFAEMASAAFEKSGLPGLTYRESDFALKIPGRDATIFLHNSYTNYCAVPRSGRQEVLSKLVASFASIPEIPSDFGSARKNLMPVIRDEAHEGMIRLMGEREPDDPGLARQYKPFAKGLLAGLAYDIEHSSSSVNFKTLQSWDVDLDQAFAVAKENLWDGTRPDGFEGASGVYWSRWGDSYDSSRMLLTELIYRLSVDGDPVAFVPNRDTLLVTGANNIAGLRIILNAARKTTSSRDIRCRRICLYSTKARGNFTSRKMPSCARSGLECGGSGMGWTTTSRNSCSTSCTRKVDVDVYVAGY